MARDASGTYTRVSNSFSEPQSQTVISPTDAEAFFDELETEMTDSLSRSGKGGMSATAALKIADGTSAAPALTFNNDTDTGIARTTANTMIAVASGVAVITVQASMATIPNATISAATITTATINGGTISGITDLAIADGGTAASTAASARANLGLTIGTDVQAYSARLADIATITFASGDILYHNGSNIVKLAKGADGEFLRLASGVPDWEAIPGGGDLLSTNNLSDVANAATSFANIKQAATASATGVVKRQRIAIVRDEKTSATDGGDFTSGADRTRVLNTEASDLDGIVSLASNQFTLQAGTWLIEWSAPAFRVDEHQSLLYNATDAIEVSRGTSESSVNAGSYAQTRSIGRAIVTIAGAKAFEIRHRGETTQAGNGFGRAGSYGTEVYTEVIITSYDQ
jgi:hypothetical protein